MLITKLAKTRLAVSMFLVLLGSIVMPAVAFAIGSPTISFYTNPIRIGNVTSVEVTGTAAPDSTVTVNFVDSLSNTSTAVTTATAGGLFSITSLNLSARQDGLISITATAEDSTGVSAPTSPISVLKDTQTTTPTISFVTDMIYSGNLNDVQVTGTAEGTSTVYVYFTDSTTTVSTTRTASQFANGFYVDLTSSGLADGTITVAAVTFDQVGNQSATSTAYYVRKDTVSTTPTVSVSNPIYSGNLNSVSVTGTAEASASVSLMFQDQSTGTYNTTVTANGSGIFSNSLNLTSAGLADGTITVTAMALDTFGNVSSSTVCSIKKDTTAPITTITPTPASPNGAGGWYKMTAPTISLNSTDTSATIYYKWDNGSYAVATSTITALEDSHTLTVYAVDSAGNTETAHSQTFKVDTHAPTTTITASPASPNGANGWYRTAPAITLGADETSTVYYKWDSDSYQTYSTTLTPSPGTHTLYTYAVDSAGNTETAHSQAFKVDTNAPTTTVSISPASPNGANGWYKETTPTITLSADETATIHYRWDGGSDVTYTVPFLALEDSHTLTVYAVDSAGNTETAHNHQLKVDTIAPNAPSINAITTVNNTNKSAITISGSAEVSSTVYITASNGSTSTASLVSNGTYSAILDFTGLADGTVTVTAYAADIAENSSTVAIATVVKDTSVPTSTITASPASPNGANGWYNSIEPTITLSSNETSATIYYKWDSGSYAVATSTVTAPEGIHTLYAYAADTANNTETPHSQQFKVDTANPITTKTVSPASPDGANGWYRAAPTITFTANETSTIYYKWDSGSYQTYSTTLTPSEGAHTLYFYAVDTAGNTETVSNQAFKVDTNAPTTTISASPASPNGSNGWYKGTAPTITLSSNDSSATVYYKWDAGSDVTYTVPFAAVENSHTLTVYAVDSAGNTETAHGQAFKVDTIAPSAPSINAVSPFNSSNASSVIISGSAEASATVYIAASSGTTVTASAVSNGTYAAVLNLSGLADGTVMITAYAVDVAGNTGSVTTSTTSKDTSAPTSTITTYPSTPNGENGYYKETIPTITLSADETSTIYYKWDSGSYQTYSTTLTPSQGMHTLYVFAADSASNTETAHSKAYKVDTIAPTVTGTDPGNTEAGVAVNKTITVTFSENVYADTTFTSTSLKDSLSNAVPKSKSISSAALTIDPTDNLSYSENYTVSIPMGAVKDIAGNTFASLYTFSFAAELDTTSPTAPSLSIITLPNSDFKASWTASTDAKSGVNGYVVSVNASDTTVTSTSHTFTPTPDTTYTVAVKAFDKCGNYSTASTETAILRTTPAAPTPSGSDVTVAVKPASDVAPVTINFSTVNAPGETSVTVSPTNSAGTPSGFNLLGSYFDIKTAADTTGTITITLPFNGTGLTTAQKLALKLYHYEAGQWKNVTKSVDADNNLITGETTSLSPFAICMAQGPPAIITPAPADKTAPATPKRLRVVSTRRIVYLKWNKNSESDLAGYNVYRRLKWSNKRGKLNSRPLTKAECMDRSAKRGKTYYYYITAVDRSGNESRPVMIGVYRRR